ncbi:AmmeMemoRadiSam system radical SAM enzyme [candidate division KSB1 bacterium]|nr:AmmeMemoRadiSam system radical SAM enzyme [candidate division KSB1 bacterium]RQW02508.1 MAG: AmmeMemoRadiSam system radical SAM enzyme [candidate division KSB1 bacterium]
MNKMNRRKFLQSTVGSLAGWPLLARAQERKTSGLVEARYYIKLPNRKIQCKLCPRECIIDDLERGYCGVRENSGGTYYSLVYGKLSTAHVDPIEKKPLFHFLPGTTAFSIATVGCNVMCKFCQNWELSQSTPEQVESFNLPPHDVAQFAKSRGCASIAYTYNEPVIFTEYMYDSAVQGNDVGIRSVMISNGYINPEPMRDLCSVLSGVKIDLKAYTERFYRELVAGELRPVLDTLVLLKKENMWTEIVYLVIPGQNDDRKELEELCAWIYKELGPDTPLHFSRFHPQYRLKNLPSTPLKTLTMARQIGLDSGLHFVYTGNVPGDPGENTYCPVCGQIVIRRVGFSVVGRSLNKGTCEKCGAAIAGVWF